MSDTVFTTERLAVRRWRAADFDTLLRIYGDAQAMRWVGDGLPITPEDCRRWLDVTAENYRRRGYGMFMLESRAEGVPLGCAGLVHPGGQPEAEVKYALLREVWGRGVATEAVRGLLDWGHRACGLTRVIATAAPANLASHRVLLKCGLRRDLLRDNGDGSFTQLFVWDAEASPPTSR